MIIVMQPGSTEEQRRDVIREIEALEYKAHVIYGVERTVVACVGHEDKTPLEHLRSMPGVEQAIPILKPFKLASLETSPERTEIDLGDGVTIGGRRLTLIAGPGAVESEEQVHAAARAVKAGGAQILRATVFQPGENPYMFQGLREDGLRLLSEAARSNGLKTLTEVASIRDLDICLEYADVLMLGARNCANFPLLQEIGQVRKPVALKRGMAIKLSEYLQAAEHVLAGGNYELILCERGIRTFEDATRFTLDLNAVPALRAQTHLPVIVDPSHGTGDRRLVGPMAKAAVACGADGLMLEAHPDPQNAELDGPQSLAPNEFEALVAELRKVAAAVDREIV